MSQDFPPAYLPPTGERHDVEDGVIITHSAKGETPGIHMQIEGHTYFLDRATARRAARQILFKAVE